MNNSNQGTVQVLSTLTEIFATIRSALSTYAVAMTVSGGDQAFSVFTVAVVELALVLSTLSIGYDVISPVTAVVTLAFSIVMQWCEIALLQGAMTEDGKNMLRMALAFAPSAILALGILRRIVTQELFDFDAMLTRFREWWQPKKGSRSVAFTVPYGKQGKLRKRTCSECGTEFETRSAKRLTCNDACRSARSRRLKASHDSGVNCDTGGE